MAKDLEAEARDALEMVTRHGVNGAPVNRDALNYGLEHRLYGQADVNNAQLAYQQKEARDALEMVTRHGVNGAPVNRDALNYGLEHKIFSQSDIDAAQTKYKKS